MADNYGGGSYETQSHNWRVDRYKSPLVWLERLIKVIALAIALYSISAINKNFPLIQLPPSRIAQIVFFSLAGGVEVAICVAKVFDREILALFFQLSHLLGHMVLNITIILSDKPSAYIFVYTFLIVLGETIRLLYTLLTPGLACPFFKKWVQALLVGIAIVMHLVVLIIQVVRSLTEYDA
eukprot:TRINITY_DN10208_c0_g1_i1.p1 TRINITY_DN10208_c0_g1~~TRINITY_DN10208_c0_g1_i1.p1  ORF type:complete len:181 (+),score=45.33 TRINITY_DN10208_c0_g1_i1:133-675(+)